MVVYVTYCSSRLRPIQFDATLRPESLFRDFLEQGIDKSSFYIVCNGKRVGEDDHIYDDKIYHIIPRLPGGKGGFGSMLRAIGAQIEKTTSREACRDLSGRRMRDINNEKKLKEWLAKEAEREREKEQRRQDRLARKLATPQHKFDDPEYQEQRAKVEEDLQDALTKGLKRAHKKGDTSGASVSKKAKTEAGPSSSKTEWLGMDIDSDDLDSDPEEANPGDPDMQTDTAQTEAAAAGSTRLGMETPSDSECSKSSESPSVSPKPFSACHLEVAKEPSTAASHDSHNATENHGNKSASQQSLPSFKSPQQHSLLSSMPPPVSHGVSKQMNEQVSSNEPVDLDNYESSDELAELGLERLKNALMERGLKCGGTLEERAQRLFSVKGLAPEQIDPSLFAKSKGKGKKSKSVVKH